MKRLLFATISLTNGGAERSLVNLLNELNDSDISIDLLLFRKEGMFLSQVPSNVNIIVSEAAEKLYKPLLKAKRFAVIKLLGTLISKFICIDDYKMREFRWRHFYSRHIEKLKDYYDVAVAYLEGEVTYFVCDKVNAKRKIAWVHTDYTNAESNANVDFKYYKQYDNVVTISDECKDKLQKEFKEIAYKFLSLPNITSASEIKRRASEFYPEEYSNINNIILSIGRLVPLKRFDAAVQSAFLLKKTKKSFKWYLIGNGECEKELKKLIKSYGVDDCFIMLGARENPYPYIKNADVVVQTSKYEGKSMVLDEAKILGIPIVSTNYDTVFDQIENEQEGLIVGMEANDIAEGILRLLNDNVLSKHISTYLKNHDYDSQSDVMKYKDLFLTSK